MTDGLKLMAWGFFQKLVVADRLATIVNPIFDHPREYHGLLLIVGAVAFTFEIYFDFAGYSNIAIGAAQVMGIGLMTNFRRPFYSKSIAEFWKRWHISLSTWFRDYLFLPLSRRHRSRLWWHFTLLLVFVLSGLWHGANWNFVMWGAVHGTYLVCGAILVPYIPAILQDNSKALVRVYNVIRVFALVCLASVFFRADHIGDAFFILRHMPTGLWGDLLRLAHRDLHGLVGGHGLPAPKQWALVVLGIAVTQVGELAQRSGSVRLKLSSSPAWVRWPAYFGLVYATLLFANAEPIQFILLSVLTRMNASVQRFCLKAAILAAPFLVVLSTYLVCDPFRVLRTYDFGDYYDQAAPVELNRDYVSLQLFWKYFPEKRFDSLIFGSSRSFPFHCDAWAKYIPGASPFHYPAASENIYGVLKKLTYLDSKGIRLRNALLELGRPALAGATPRYDATHRLPYALSGESWLDFQGGFLKAFLTDFYFAKYMDFKLRGGVDAFSRSVLGIRPGAIHISPQTNDLYFASFDRELAENPVDYYTRHGADFPPHADAVPACAEPVILGAQRDVLARIRAELDRQGTDYRILLTPEYGQECLNPLDARELVNIFGEDRVFNFLGVNEFTSTKTNFYDAEHVRPAVADRILAAIYEGTRSGPAVHRDD